MPAAARTSSRSRSNCDDHGAMARTSASSPHPAAGRARQTARAAIAVRSATSFWSLRHTVSERTATRPRSRAGEHSGTAPLATCNCENVDEQPINANSASTAPGTRIDMPCWCLTSQRSASCCDPAPRRSFPSLSSQIGQRQDHSKRADDLANRSSCFPVHDLPLLFPDGPTLSRRRVRPLAAEISGSPSHP